MKNLIFLIFFTLLLSSQLIAAPSNKCSPLYQPTSNKDSSSVKVSEKIQNKKVIPYEENIIAAAETAAQFNREEFFYTILDTTYFVFEKYGRVPNAVEIIDYFNYYRPYKISIHEFTLAIKFLNESNLIIDKFRPILEEVEHYKPAKDIHFQIDLDKEASIINLQKSQIIQIRAFNNERQRMEPTKQQPKFGI